MGRLVHKVIEECYKVLEGQSITRKDALALVYETGRDDLLDLISLANKVRKKFKSEMVPCSIINAKSGKCSQNCRFCAQSVHHDTGIKTYDLLDSDEILSAAEEVFKQGVRIFGLVTSGFGYLKANAEFDKILKILDLLHKKFPDLKICASVGILSHETAQLLAQHHIWRYNMNLQTNPAHYVDLVANTHSIEYKIQTIRYLKEFGVTNCTGGIWGLGETWEDRIDMAFAIKELDIECSPLNVLLPIKGTPLEDSTIMNPADVAKAFAIFRLINPTKGVKFAAGRETVMKDFQALLMLSGADSFITGGYLTTRGRSVEDDLSFIEKLSHF